KEHALSIQRQIEQLNKQYEQKICALEQQFDSLRQEHATILSRLQEDNHNVVIVKAMHEDRLIAYVPEEHVSNLRGLLTTSSGRSARVPISCSACTPTTATGRTSACC
ncbi:hypothetical protein Vretifemale_3430, partial [Volvox reticuliferus]